MEFSLCLSFNGAKTIKVAHPFRNSHRQCRASKVSCRVGTLNTGTKTTFYDLLSLNSCENFGTEEIKKAYRCMVLQYHPDVCPPSRREESTQIFIEIHKAYKTLSDPILREKYDYELGLTDLSKSKLEAIYNGEAKPIFSRQRWEDQLSGLKRMSDYRLRSIINGSWATKTRARHG